MAIETKDIIEFLGYKPDEIKELADLKTKFDAEFVRSANINEDSEPVKKILGKTLGLIENDIKKVANKFELGIDFDGADYQANKKVNDKLKFIFDKYEDKNKTTIADLTLKAGQGNDDKVKELQSKWEKATQKAKDNETLLNSTKTEFETYKTNTVNEIKSKTINGIKKDIYSKAKFLPDANEFTKKGFLTSFEEKYSFDLDENESPIITDKKGVKILSKKVAGAFKTPYEVLEEELIEAKLFPLNPNGGQAKPATLLNNQQAQQQQQAQGKPTRRVATPL